MVESDATVVERFWTQASRTERTPYGLVRVNPQALTLSLASYLAHPDWPPGELSRAVAGAAAVVGADCRRVLVDRETPAVVEADLVLAGWRLDQLVLLQLAEGEPGPRSEEPLRPIADAPGWAELEALFRIDHIEEDRRAGREVRPATSTRQSIALRRSLAEATWFLADRAGAAVGAIAGWVDPVATGVIEDVFVHPDHRGHGIATAMIGAVIEELRERGARTVVIAAEADDTPKQLYAALGFRPFAVSRSYVPG